MKTDARVRYTRMVIKQNFFQLLKEKPIGKITVKEICERSEINRATFYKHYSDPFDLLEKTEEEMLQHLKETLLHKEYKDVKAIYTDVLTQIKLNHEQYKNIGSAHGDPNLSHRIFMVCYEHAFPLITGKFSHLSQSQQNMLYYFITLGCSGTMQYWMQNGMQEPPEEVAAFLEKTIFSIARHYTKKE